MYMTSVWLLPMLQLGRQEAADAWRGPTAWVAQDQHNACHSGGRGAQIALLSESTRRLPHLPRRQAR